MPKTNVSQNNLSHVSKVKIKSTDENLSNLIENKVEGKSSNKNFFSKRNLVILVICFIATIAILGLTVKYVLDIQWNVLFNAINSGFAQKIGMLWFSLLIVTFVWYVIREFAILSIRLRENHIYVPLYEYILFSFTKAFLNAVAPWMIGDAYSIYWLKVHNIPTHLATSIAFSNTLLWQIIQIVVTFPSFVIFLCYSNRLIYVNGALDSQGLTILILLCAGMFVDFCSVGFMILLNMSKKLHFAMSFIFNKIKKLFHLKYHTKEEIAEKYKDREILKQDFVKFVHNQKYFWLCLLIFTFGELMTYFSLCFSFYFVQNIEYQGQIYLVKFDFWAIFNCANISFTANRFNFIIPNGSVSLEWIISVSAQRLGGWAPLIDRTKESEVYKLVTTNGLLVWRSIGIIQAFFGFFTLIWLVIVQIKQIKASSRLKQTMLY